MPRIVNHVMKASFLADSAVTDKYIVKAGSNDEDVALATASDTPIGLALETAADNKTVDVLLFGCGVCIAGGNVTRGALVESDANGKGIAITPGSTTSDTNVLGTAMETAVSGDEFSVFVGFNTHVIE